MRFVSAITANFINKKSEAEARVEEISGVAFIFNQKFFKDLQAETRIDLENIVYYKDDTHYFVMTAKKASLLEKGVIKQVCSIFQRCLTVKSVKKVSFIVRLKLSEFIKKNCVASMQIKIVGQLKQNYCFITETVNLVKIVKVEIF